MPMLWFDFGGVLSPPMAELFRLYQDKTGITPEQLQAAVADVAGEMGEEPLAPIELALISEAEWGRRLRRALVERTPDIDLGRARLEGFGAQWFDGVSANPAMAEAVRRARQHGFATGVLSNNVVEWRPYWREIIAPIGAFDHVVDSCEVGFRKPDPRIFEVAEKAAGIAAEDCVLVDDLAVNCAAARDRGWRTVHFRDNAQALADLHDLTGVPHSPDPAVTFTPPATDTEHP